MGQDEILNMIISRGADVPVGEINKLFKPKGPVCQQLTALRNKKLVGRKQAGKSWVYFPTAEALELARQREAGADLRVGVPKRISWRYSFV
jgi:hypothetical protein